MPVESVVLDVATLVSPSRSKCNSPLLPSDAGGAHSTAVLGETWEDNVSATLRRLGDEVRLAEGHRLHQDLRLSEVDVRLLDLSRKLDAHALQVLQFDTTLSAMATSAEPSGQALGSNVGIRLSALERGQKTLAVSAERALANSLSAQQEQSQWSAKIEKALDSLSSAEPARAGAEEPVGALHEEWRKELERIDRRLDDHECRLVSVDEKVATEHFTRPAKDPASSSSATGAALLEGMALGNFEEWKHFEQRLDEHERRLLEIREQALAAQLAKQSDAISELRGLVYKLQTPRSAPRSPNPPEHERERGRDGRTAQAEPEAEDGSPDQVANVAAGSGGNKDGRDRHSPRWGSGGLRGCVETLRLRLDALQEVVDERLLVQLWQLSRKVPEVAAHLDRLREQCQECIGRSDACEVHIETLRGRLQAFTELGDRLLEGEALRSQDVQALKARMLAQAAKMQELREELLHHGRLGVAPGPLEGTVGSGPVFSSASAVSWRGSLDGGDLVVESEYQDGYLWPSSDSGLEGPKLGIDPSDNPKREP